MHFEHFLLRSENWKKIWLTGVEQMIPILLPCLLLDEAFMWLRNLQKISKLIRWHHWQDRSHSLDLESPLQLGTMGSARKNPLLSGKAFSWQSEWSWYTVPCQHQAFLFFIRLDNPSLATCTPFSLILKIDCENTMSWFSPGFLL